MKDPDIQVASEARGPLPRRTRRVIALLWSGFIGAVLALLGLLAGWDRLHFEAEAPALGTLAVAFFGAWLVCVISATVAWSLASPPQGRRDD